MNLESCLLALAFVVLGISAAAVALARSIAYWKREGLRLQSDKSYRTPATSWWRRFVLFVAGRLAAFWFLGRFRVIGRLPRRPAKGRFIFVVNHQTEADSVVMVRLLGMRRIRYLVAFNQARGVRAAGVAFSGGIVADFFDEVGSGAPAVNVEQPTRKSVTGRLVEAVNNTIDTLNDEPDSDFLIFPQGKLVRTNELKRADFQDGAVKIGRALNEPVYYVPIGVHFDHNPDNRSWFAKLLNAVGISSFGSFFKTLNAQTVVAIGEPLSVEELPADRKQATTVLFDRVKSLVSRAKAAA